MPYNHLYIEGCERKYPVYPASRPRARPGLQHARCLLGGPAGKVRLLRRAPAVGGPQPQHLAPGSVSRSPGRDAVAQKTPV